MPARSRALFGTLCVSFALSGAVLPASGQEQHRHAETIASAVLPDAPGLAVDENAASARSVISSARIGGTVTDTNGNVIPGATIVLDAPSGAEHRTATADGNAGFEFDGLEAGVTYRLTVSAKGFADWKSPSILLHGGDFQFVAGIRLPVLGESTNVMVTAGTQEEIATQQVHIEEQQRVLGFIPNFYVVYDAKNAVPLTTKLKYQMALKVTVDPISFLGAAFLAGIEQASDTPNFPQGAKGYGERFGAVYTDGATDTFFGGAILPSLLHQDPRYFYQGTGSIKSRTLHALASPFICRSDNGKLQPNYSSVGGDLISSAISNAYYPPSNRGWNFTFGNLAVETAERAASTVIQEFIVRKLTPSANRPQ
jgi:hypothetical protein